MRISEPITIFLAIISIATALEGFATVSLFWKLIALTVGFSALLWVAIGHMRLWVRPRALESFTQTDVNLRNKRYAISAAGLAFFSFLFVVVGFRIINFYAVRVEKTSTPDDKAAITIYAPIQHVNELIITLPSKDNVDCLPFDSPGGPDTQANVEGIDTDGHIPQWTAKDFFHPQVFNLKCVPALSPLFMKLRASPPKIDILYPPEQKKYETYTFIGGGLIWILAIIALWFR